MVLFVSVARNRFELFVCDTGLQVDEQHESLLLRKISCDRANGCASVAAVKVVLHRDTSPLHSTLQQAPAALIDSCTSTTTYPVLIETF
jgi:hypothetical protein